MQKVTQVLYSGLGGHASVAFSLLDGDVDKQWQPSMLFVGVEPLELAYQHQCVAQGIDFGYVRSRQGRPWSSWVAVFKSLSCLRPDVVLLHSVSSLPPVALYCLLHSVRLIAVEHTPIALKSYAERLMSWLALLLVKRIVVLTEAYKIEHLGGFHWFQSQSKVVVIPNGIDVVSYSPAESRMQSDTVQIGMAARFSCTKRQDLLVSAILLLERRHPEIRWRLSLAGYGDCYHHVHAQVERMGLTGRVELAGNLGPVDLRSWFQSLDLYAHASEGEALSTSMLQAMATGLPIVASNVPGIKNLLHIDGRQLGLLSDDNTAEAFADGISILHFNLTLQEELSSAARACVMLSYNHQVMFKSYNSLIQGALN